MLFARNKYLGLCYTHASGFPTYLAKTNARSSEDSDDSCSISGFVILLAYGLIAYKSQTQPSVMLSSMEVKYMGQTLIATNVRCVWGLLKKLDIKEMVSKSVIVIYTINLETIKLAENHIFYEERKHIVI